MRSVSQSDAAALLPVLIDGLSEQSVAIERNGQDVAVLVTTDDYEYIREQKRLRLMDSVKRLSETIRSSVKDESELEELMRSLDRKAS